MARAEFRNFDGGLEVTGDDNGMLIAPGDTLCFQMRTDRFFLRLECWEYKGHQGYFSKETAIGDFDIVIFDSGFNCTVRYANRPEPVEVTLNVRWDE